MALRVFALAAHPDDIEFGMGGTLILLARAGCEIHYMNIASGSCGSAEHDADTTAEIRLAEAQSAAGRISAVFHRPLVGDLEIFYEPKLLARVASVMRAVAPDILLAPSPQDYIEDHENACRLAVTAAFCRGMPNFTTVPPHPPVGGDIVVYHAQPHGNRDSLNRLIQPDFCVDITTVIEDKTAMLGEHKSQKTWLDQSQGMNAYLDMMKDYASQVGTLARKCKFAEGWRRHNPLGFCAAQSDPLADLLEDHVIGG
ncbi:MAG: LmbE family protein [Phycisphaerales bacterium]|nr:LmbE family protein [Phycisphaerales bacterium]